MSCGLLDVVDNHFSFYYAIAESIKDSKDVVYFILSEQHKIMSSWSISNRS